MNKEAFTLAETFPTSAEKLFHAWLDSVEHSAMTGGEAVIDPNVGGKFTAWDGYISGKTTELDPCRKIVQTWRTAEFDEADDDSLLTITFSPEGDGTKVTLHHTNVPKGQTQYVEGWKEHYFEPMQEYFG